MKKYSQAKLCSVYNDGDEGYEVGYADALKDVFLLIWEFIPRDGWISERDLIDKYLNFLSESEEARKDWPETASYVKLALRQFKMNGLIVHKTFKD